MEKDLPGAISAILNELPPSMEVTRDLIVGLVRAAAEYAQQQVAPTGKRVGPNLLPVLLHAIVGLENRFERLEGRPGFDDSGTLGRLLGEFGLKG